MTVVSSGCSISDLVKLDSNDQDQPVNPDVVDTYSGSMALYYGAVHEAAAAAASQLFSAALATDELQAGSRNSRYKETDARTEEGMTLGLQPWTALAATQRAIGALARYRNQASPAVFSELYALRGMAAIWLAESSCNGVPLTDSPFKENFRYTRGYTTVEVLDYAIASFDTSLTYGEDSLRIATLAKVGRARALLNLGRYSDAEMSVAGIPTSSAYVAYYHQKILGVMDEMNQAAQVRIVNSEGRNGLRWIATTPAAQDPRVPLATRVLGDGSLGFTVPARQAKYSPTGTLRVADGIEARLIEAEVALRRNDTIAWAAILNTLRASALPTPIPTLSADSTILATPRERVDIMFRERAYWLFLTGHRQGDFRRLVRYYGRDARDLYPIGDYVWSSELVLYDDRYTYAPSPSEQERNPLYNGCLDRNP